MPLKFEETAAREHLFLRAFFMGPTGSGKSAGALALADALAQLAGGPPITLINTEIGRGKLYADRHRYSLIDVSEEGDFAPETFVDAINLAESRNPGGIIVVDSSTHEWAGKGGVLELAGRFNDWGKVRPRHADWVERMLQVQGHVIVTCRAKMKYEVEEVDEPGRAKKKQVITALGIGPIQDGDLQYEFNLVGRFEQQSKLVTFSGHVDPLVEQTVNLRDQAGEVAETLYGWLTTGTPPEVPVEAPEGDVEALLASLRAEGIAEPRIQDGLARGRAKNKGVLTGAYVAEALAASKKRLDAKGITAPEPEPAADAVAVGVDA